ncbi:MAG: sulfite exporter TauE/SafE family protein [Candidatus Acidiferrales bacterium]
MTSLSAILLFLAAVLGGALNSVVGGGTFVVFPALLIAGVPAVAANATATIVLWPGGISSALAYRDQIRLSRTLLIALSAASLLGGGIGAVLLVRTPGAAFVRLVPWLLLFATALLSFGGKLNSLLGVGSGAAEPGRHATFTVAAIQFLISIYGGYFGAGMGILMLAALALARVGNIHVMNGIRTVLGALINAVALVLFVFVHLIAWRPAILMIVGATLAGYAGAAIAKRIDPKIVKRCVIVIAWTMTAYFFLKTYHVF